MKFNTKDGRKLTYRKMGNGPVLVCHPGGPGFGSAYLGDLAGLWERFTLVILNPRGTSHSDRPADAGAYHLADYVADLEELREHLSLERMMLLGYSHGGIVAQSYAAEHPGRVSRLVLASTSAHYGPRQQAATQAALEKRSGQPWYADAEAAAREHADTDEQVRDNIFRRMPFNFARFGPAEAGYLDTFRSEPINGDALRVFNREIPEVDLRDSLSRIAAPTLVITGDDDFVCGPACAAEITAAIPGAREVIVGDAGHFLFVDQPEVFRDEVADFLLAP